MPSFGPYMALFGAKKGIIAVARAKRHDIPKSRSSGVGWTRRQTAKRGMSASLLLALGMAVLDEEDLHAFFGLGFLLLHLSIHKKAILR